MVRLCLVLLVLYRQSIFLSLFVTSSSVCLHVLLYSLKKDCEKGELTKKNVNK